MADETTPVRRRKTTKTPKWNKASILLAIRLWAQKTEGVPPTAREWRKATAKHPSNQTVREHFSSWDEAMRQAGYAPRGRGRPKGTRSRNRERRAA